MNIGTQSSSAGGGASSFVHLVASSVRLAECAGRFIKSVLTDGDLKIVDKSQVEAGKPGKTLIDPQTRADRLVECLIKRSLQSKFGTGLTINGEEGNVDETVELESSEDEDVVRELAPHAAKLGKIHVDDLVVWVDPLDGTSEFVQAAADKDKRSLLEQITVLIGIACEGKAFAGIVHQPYYQGQSEKSGRTIWGIKGVGVFGINCVTSPEGEPRLGVTTSSHPSKLNNEAISALRESGLLSEVVPIGGAGYKVLQLLEGYSAYIYASDGTKKWDTCAPQAILEANGGRLTDMAGEELCYEASVQERNSSGILATASNVDHQKFVDCIPQRVKDALPKILPTRQSQKSS